MIYLKNIQNWQVKVQGSWTYSRYAVTFASAGHRLPVLAQIRIGFPIMTILSSQIARSARNPLVLFAQFAPNLPEFLYTGIVQPF
jgi:hypothetical protein